MSAYRVFVGCCHWIKLERKIVLAVNHGLTLVFIFVIIIAVAISFYVAEIVFLIVFVVANFIGFTNICTRVIFAVVDFDIATFHVIASIIMVNFVAGFVVINIIVCADVSVANFG